MKAYIRIAEGGVYLTTWKELTPF